MSDEIKGLIEKIQQEGIGVAEAKAKEIGERARQEAEEILKKAKKDAERILAEAKEDIAGMQAKERALLAQAGRDLLLSLRQEINAVLGRVILSEVRQALTPDALAKMLSGLIKGSGGEQIVVGLKEEDCQALEEGFLSKLKDEVKKGITLNPSEDIRGGFTLSFDAGKSCYDFTDKALSEYIGAQAKGKLSQILKSQ